MQNRAPPSGHVQNTAAAAAEYEQNRAPPAEYERNKAAAAECVQIEDSAIGTQQSVARWYDLPDAQ